MIRYKCPNCGKSYQLPDREPAPPEREEPSEPAGLVPEESEARHVEPAPAFARGPALAEGDWLTRAEVYLKRCWYGGMYIALTLFGSALFGLMACVIVGLPLYLFVPSMESHQNFMFGILFGIGTFLGLGRVAFDDGGLAANLEGVDCELRGVVVYRLRCPYHNDRQCLIELQKGSG